MNPSLPPRQIISRLAEKWKEANTEERGIYQEQAEEELLKYRARLGEWKARNPNAARTKKQRKKPNAGEPKRPKSNFFAFMEEFRPLMKAENPTLDTKEFESPARWVVAGPLGPGSSQIRRYCG